jgi:hypothetical protein
MNANVSAGVENACGSYSCGKRFIAADASRVRFLRTSLAASMMPGPPPVKS